MSAHHPIPHHLYESLPFIYLGSGVLVAQGLANALGYFSGLVLFSASALVGWKRWQYRHARPPSRPRQPTAAKAAPAPLRAPSRPQLVWRREYECGHVTLDSQHRRLFELGNALIGAIYEQHSKLDVELLLGELVDGVTDHFCFEERLLAGSHHPHAASHQAAHHHLLARCREMSEQFHQDHLKAGGLIEFIVLDVVERHILEDDRAFAGN